MMRPSRQATLDEDQVISVVANRIFAALPEKITCLKFSIGLFIVYKSRFLISTGSG
jgi:hypothetical protein